MKKMSYAKALHKGFIEVLENDPDVFIVGQGLWSPWYVGSTMTDLEKIFGKDRILDTPVSENATTGIAIGAAIAGKKPIIVHPRMDFMLLAMDPIINQASNWSYLFQGEVSVPIVIRSIINRGGEQGAQHSQALQSLFMHIPGLKVVMPAMPNDAKSLLIASVNDPNPVIFIDDRWCYDYEDFISDDINESNLGEAKVIGKGEDLTIVAMSYMVHEALKARDSLLDEGVSIEVVDLRTIKPWDSKTIIDSVKKTKRMVVADTGWMQNGVSSEISSLVGGQMHSELMSPNLRVALPNIPAPCARSLEEVYYPNANTLINAVNISLGKKSFDSIECLTKTVPGLISY
jgi:acetoin:2,6-dichlorophenolindophenol oxidoreductase subunit beta